MQFSTKLELVPKCQGSDDGPEQVDRARGCKAMFSGGVFEVGVKILAQVGLLVYGECSIGVLSTVVVAFGKW